MATFIKRIDDGDDDAANLGIFGNPFNNSNISYDLNILYSPNVVMGMRFQNVTIPQGSTINNATLEIWMSKTGEEITNNYFYGVDEDDLNVWAETTNEPIDAATTTAFYDFGFFGEFPFVQPFDLPITNIIQEIVNREGWVSGNNMGIIVKEILNQRLVILRGFTYENNPTRAPKLTINYTPPSTGTNMQIKIGGTLKDVLEMKINRSGVLKDVLEVKQNIGGVLKDVF